MAVRMVEINVKSWGPLTDFRITLGAVNLIYGRNEQGKTHRVEFILRSLFKKPGMDGLRTISGRGCKYWLVGLWILH